jgi:hypothetical protein
VESSEEREQRHAEERRAVEEAGGGEAEGFEQAEADLVEQASHGEGGGDPMDDAFDEEEDERATRTYSEPDEVDPTEVTSDPDEGPEDPGEGPGISSER